MIRVLLPLLAVLGALADRTGLRPAAADLRHEPFRRALRELLALKEELEPGSEGVFGAFQARPPGAAPAAPDGPGETPEDRVLEALGADAGSGNEEDALRAELRVRLEHCAAALAEAALTPRSRPADR